MALSLSISLTTLDAEAGSRGLLSRYFRKIPVAEALETFGYARNRDLNGESIKVLVWNIKKGQEKPWKSEFSSYSRGKDLFLLQEAYETDLVVDTIKSYEGFRWDFGRSFTYAIYNNRGTGTMLGSHAEPVDVLVTHSPDHEPITNTPKAMTYARYALAHSAKTLLVISVHAINFRELGPFKRHMLQAKAEIEKHDGPVLFAGDFNTHLRERIRYLTTLMREMKFTEVSFLHGDQRMRAPITRNFLDHAFVRGLSVKAAEVIPESRGSDHRPLVLELSVTDPAIAPALP